ncbi:nuclear transport factor 2 family protein [Streptomyces sp. NPDC020951]|uniref:nuclear transport factor 2 family protein n=1 Tax=Streptomyces sp. NPDC020951 TaxID=3365104 RepID=UPI003796E76B
MNAKQEQLLSDHLRLIWNQRDETLRLKAIESIYAEDVVMYDMEDEVLSGHTAINQKVTDLLNSLPPGSSIIQSIPSVFQNNAGKLEWGVGTPGSPPILTGADIVFFEDDKVKSFYVFVNKEA